MGALMLIIPAMFIIICASFILVHSFYYRLKLTNKFRKKREAAKVSLVNILQLTNPSLITPSWISNGKLKLSQETEAPSKNGVPTKADCVNLAHSPTKFDPRNPNVLSSVVILREDLNLPPPCYEDLFGNKEVFMLSLEHAPVTNSPVVRSCENQTHKKETTGDVAEKNEAHLQVVPWPPERRNSSAVLYL